MSNRPGKAFRDFGEFLVFTGNYCGKCRGYEEGAPGLVRYEKEYCPVRLAAKRSLADDGLFPSGVIRELRDADDEDRVIAKHYCTRFGTRDWDVMVRHFGKMKKAILKGSDRDGQAGGGDPERD